MQQIKLKCLVIREVDFSEHDRYITVLTEYGRRIEVLCRNARRKGSRAANAARLFCWSEFSLYERHGKFSFNDAELICPFWGVTQEIESYALACYMAELGAVLSSAEEDSPALTRLFLGALRLLSEHKRSPTIIKPSFELRLMAESGFLPQLDPCAVCGVSLEPDAVWFSVRAGTAACTDCARRLGADYRQLPKGTLAAMQHIVSADLKKVYSFSLGGDSLRILNEICEDFTIYYTDKLFDSLRFYHSLVQL